MAIQIATGNPFGKLPKPASYTRFILPFAYRKIETGKCATGEHLFWQTWPDTEIVDLEWRKQYFTQETTEVLFGQSRWFRLHRRNENNDGLFCTDFDLTLEADRTKRTTMWMNAPMLVIFEFRER